MTEKTSFTRSKWTPRTHAGTVVRFAQPTEKCGGAGRRRDGVLVVDDRVGELDPLLFIKRVPRPSSSYSIRRCGCSKTANGNWSTRTSIAWPTIPAVMTASARTSIRSLRKRIAASTGT